MVQEREGKGERGVSCLMGSHGEWPNLSVVRAPHVS